MTAPVARSARLLLPALASLAFVSPGLILALSLAAFAAHEAPVRAPAPRGARA
ncbi:MAG: hypothetical protein LJF30_00930 [Acidobacteria bacterium]|nr:hypothetical protein [Acidobacteriota bacterium]